MSKSKPKVEKQLQYYVKIAGALNELFNEDSEFYLDLTDKDFDGNSFFHVLATRVPQMVMAKLSGQEMDPLTFNHAMCRLIFQENQDQIENKKG